MSTRRTPAQRSPIEGLPLTLTAKQFAHAYGVSRDSVVRWLDAGKLRAVVTPGGLRRIPSSELARLLEIDP